MDDIDTQVDDQETSEDSESNEDSSSSDVKKDVKSGKDSDDKGVSWENRAKEFERKLKSYDGVDLEKWAKAKDLDFDRVEKALKLDKLVTKDRETMEKVFQALGVKKDSEGGSSKGSKDSGNPEIREVKEMVAKLAARLEAQDSKEWMDKYRSSMDTAISESLKKDDFKDAGGPLKKNERRLLIKLVDETFERDSRLDEPKLGHDDVPSVVEKVLKEIISDRKEEEENKSTKNSKTPNPIKGGQGGSKKQEEPEDRDEIQEVKDMIDEYKKITEMNI